MPRIRSISPDLRSDSDTGPLPAGRRWLTVVGALVFMVLQVGAAGFDLWPRRADQGNDRSGATGDPVEVASGVAAHLLTPARQRETGFGPAPMAWASAAGGLLADRDLAAFAQRLPRAYEARPWITVEVLETLRIPTGPPSAHA